MDTLLPPSADGGRSSRREIENVVNWKQRLRDLARNKPDAVPEWLRQPTSRAWYRVSWQTDGGIDRAHARRPLIVVLKWFNERSLLTQNGIGTLNSILANKDVDESLTTSMVNQTATEFLDQCWDSWWNSVGMNLCIDLAVDEASATAELAHQWSTYSNT
jgi:hypothetical protein